MKIKHTIDRAIQAPDTTKVYGARVVGVKLNGQVLEYSWAVFARKMRTKKRAPTPEAK